jgi:hypothetical protein
MKEQRFVEYYLWGKKDLMQRTFIKQCLIFTVGSFCRLKRFASGLRNSLGEVRNSQMMLDKAALLKLRQKQLCRGQQSKEFYAAGFVALLKRKEKGISVGG